MILRWKKKETQLPLIAIVFFLIVLCTIFYNEPRTTPILKSECWESKGGAGLCRQGDGGVMSKSVQCICFTATLRVPTTLSVLRSGLRWI
ncbi:hypothetical protein Hdeb2414_s0022g00611191 [Helianthus debilis subsp. tardiflorus]